MSDTRKNQKYAKAYENHSGFSLSVVDLRALAEKYRLKNNIKLIINGDTQSDSVKADIDRQNSILLEKGKANGNMYGMLAIALDTGLSKPGCITEILEIQSTLQPGEVVGYVYTNGKKKSIEHFEVLIISKDTIIKPISWGKSAKSIGDEEFQKIFIADINFLLKPIQMIVAPQADQKSCGTLGLLYLKELLKDDKKQLSGYSLCVSIYHTDDEHIKKIDFFIPPAHVLRYSQSQKFNDILYNLMREGESFEVINTRLADCPSMMVSTLESLLKSSIKYAESIGDTKTSFENLQSLRQLQQLRPMWLTAYEKAMERRALFDDSHTKQNYYLLYRAAGFGSRLSSTERLPQNTSTKAEIIPEMSSKLEDYPFKHFKKGKHQADDNDSDDDFKIK